MRLTTFALPALLTFAATLSAQSNVVYSWTLQASPTDTPVTIAATQDQAVAVPNWLFAQTLGAPSALTAAATAAATTITVASIPLGLAVGNGVCFSPSALVCQIAMSTNGTAFNLVLSAGEVARVTAVTGTGPYTITLRRGAIGTAAAYLSGRGVVFLRYGSYSDLSAALLLGAQNAIVQNCAYGAFTTTAQCAALASAQTALAGVH